MKGSPTPRKRFVAEVVTSGVDLAVRPLYGKKRRTHPLEPVRDPELAADDLTLVEQDAAGTCRVVGQRLAGAGSARAGIYRIAARFGLDPVYAPDVIREAEAFRAAPGLDDPELVDLEALPFVTIDNRNSRDLDQALHIERGGGGEGYVVRYALADASYYVRPGTALFAEALRRGASFYLPGLTVPMLPRLLSEGLVSLNQSQLRRSLVFVMHLDREARRVRTELVRARVRSARKLSYPGVQRYYDDPGGSQLKGHPWQETLDLLREVGLLRLDEARRLHVVQYHRAEVEVVLSEHESLGFAIFTEERLEVERYNEQISLLCNVEGARMLAAKRGDEHLQPVFRVHPAPPAEALDSLRRQIDAVVAAHGLDAEVWRWPGRAGGEALADYLDRLPSRGRARRVRRAIERQARLLNVRSTFEEQPAPHHGIGAPVYARFSSPMREIVGVFTHKEALEMLADAAQKSAPTADLELRARVVKAGNRAKEIQRRITKEANGLVLDRVFASELAQAEVRRRRHAGTVMGLTATRLYVQLDDPAVDVKVYTRDLEAQFGCEFEADDAGVALEPQPAGRTPILRIGDPVTLYVAGFDDDRKRWQFGVE